jgi:serine/threonine-protein kinase
MLAIKALTGFSPTDLPTDPESGELVWRNHAKVSNGLAMVLTRMVKYHYTQRYQSTKEVEQGLAAFTITDEQKQQAGAIVKSTPKSGAAEITTSSRSMSQASQPSKSNSGLLVVGLLIFVGAIAFTVPIMLRSSQKPNIAVTAIPTVGTDTTPVTPTQSPTTSTPSPSPSSPSTGTSPNDPTKEPVFSQGLQLTAGEEKLEESSLKPNLIKSYTFQAKEGQNLKTELTGDNITMTVVSPDKENLATQTAAWTGKLAFTGEYQIQLKSSKGTLETNYKLKVLLGDAEAPPTRIIEINPVTPKTN